MSDKISTMEWKLKAKDETGAAYESAQQKLEHFVHESRAQAKLVKHALELGGAGIGAQMLAHSMDEVTEVVKKFAEEISKARDQTDQFQAKYHAAQGFLDSIPVVGELAKAWRAMGDAEGDADAATAKLAGASEAVQDSMRSAEGLARHNTEATKGLTEATEKHTSAIKALHAEQAKGLGISEKQRAIDEAKLAHKEKSDHLVAEQHELLKIINPTSIEKSDIELKKDEIAAETERFNQQIKNIEQKAANEEDDFNRAKYVHTEAEQSRHEQTLKDLAAEGEADRLRSLHKDFEADEVLRKQHLADQLHAVKEAEKAESEAIIKQGQERRNAGKSDFSAAELADVHKRAREDEAGLKSRAKDAEDKAAEDVKNQALDAKAEREKTLAKMRLDLLKQEGELGNKAAELAAKQVGIADKYAEQLEILNRLLREGKDITAAERADIQSQIDAMKSIEKIELDRAKRPSPEDKGSPFASGAELAYGDDGSRSAFEAGDQQREIDAAAVAAKQLDAILALNGIQERTSQQIDAMLVEIRTFSAI